jgi:hypothetical protein
MGFQQFGNKSLVGIPQKEANLLFPKPGGQKPPELLSRTLVASSVGVNGLFGMERMLELSRQSRRKSFRLRPMPPIILLIRVSTAPTLDC